MELLREETYIVQLRLDIKTHVCEGRGKRIFNQKGLSFLQKKSIDVSFVSAEEALLGAPDYHQE